MFQVVGWVSAAFKEPTEAFPGGAPAAPLDTSQTAQLKDGELMLRNLTFYDSGFGLGNVGGGICLRDNAISASPSCKLYWDSIATLRPRTVAAGGYCSTRKSPATGSSETIEVWCGSLPEGFSPFQCVPLLMNFSQEADKDNPDAVIDVGCFLGYDGNNPRVYLRSRTNGSDDEIVGLGSRCGVVCTSPY